MTTVCARCRRTLRSEPIEIEGKGYGPRCAAMVGDMFSAPVRRVAARRATPRKADARQPELFGEVRP